MTAEKRNIRLPRVAMVTRILFASFLFGTGIMTMGFAINGYPVGDTPDDVGRFMIALEQTGYLIFWVGFFKTVAGGLMFFPRTAPLAVLMSLPYVVNILLYVTFFAHQYLVIGLPDFAACALLIYCYFDWYRPILASPTEQPGPMSTSTSTPSGGDHAF
ncbi:hypothetical protein [Rhodopirellula baltica]|uniref:DoxX family protein n=1 Tax=Rhodopirellula baltica WH47 TaxID=991778 RepID=F2APR6_RHOBT|nr:hypothetical protein [Rhodopirellula baltica]EGF28333.1 conserved hypothetical protein, membrane [Rhodopirellula baltica WH47]